MNMALLRSDKHCGSFGFPPADPWKNESVYQTAQSPFGDRSFSRLLSVHNWSAAAKSSSPTRVKAGLTLRPKKGECADFRNFF